MRWHVSAVKVCTCSVTRWWLVSDSKLADVDPSSYTKSWLPNDCTSGWRGHPMPKNSCKIGQLPALLSLTALESPLPRRLFHSLLHPSVQWMVIIKLTTWLCRDLSTMTSQTCSHLQVTWSGMTHFQSFSSHLLKSHITPISSSVLQLVAIDNSIWLCGFQTFKSSN